MYGISCPLLVPFIQNIKQSMPELTFVEEPAGRDLELDVLEDDVQWLAGGQVQQLCLGANHGRLHVRQRNGYLRVTHVVSTVAIVPTQYNSRRRLAQHNAHYNSARLQKLCNLLWNCVLCLELCTLFGAMYSVWNCALCFGTREGYRSCVLCCGAMCFTAANCIVSFSFPSIFCSQQKSVQMKIQ